MFDCVWPTRLARHGMVLTEQGGNMAIRNQPFPETMNPLRKDVPAMPAVNSLVLTYAIF